MKRILVFICLLFSLCSVSAREVVSFGGISYPPLIIEDGVQHFGIAMQLLDLMNQVQTDYGFKYFHNTPETEFKKFSDGFFDHVFLFRDEAIWKNRQAKVEMSKPFLQDAIAFITRQDEAVDQAYFNELTGKQLAGMFNEPYQFANNNLDPHYLKQHYKIKLFNSNKKLIDYVLEKKGRIGIVRLSYLYQYFRLHPATREKLLISKKYDKQMQYRFLVREGATPDVAYLNRLLTKLYKKGLLQKLYAKHGLGASQMPF